MAFEFRGVEELQRNLNRLAKEYPEAAEQALHEEAEIIMADAKERCPVDTGRLRATGYVQPPSDGEVEIGFGTDYGIYVHERTELNHPSGEAKFLENAINARMDGYLERLAKRVKARAGI